MQSEQEHPVELLPFFANGTLEAEEQARVATHLTACGACRDELAFLQALHAGVRAAESPPPIGEMGWRRLQSALRKPARARRWLPWALAASLAVVMVQGVLLFQHTEEAAYQPAGQVREGTLLQVRFRPQATESAIRTLLQSLPGQIVSGPGALGVYRIRLAPEADPEAALEILRRKQDLIEHAARD